MNRWNYQTTKDPEFDFSSDGTGINFAQLICDVFPYVCWCGKC